MDDQPHVAIVVPHLGDLPGYFVDSLLGLSKPPEGGHSFYRVQDKPVDIARNALVEKALDDPHTTHVLFLDADEMIHPNTLRHLLDCKVPLVSGLVFARSDYPAPHLYSYVRTDALGIRWYHGMGEEFMDFLDQHPEAVEQPNCMVFPFHHLIKCDAVGAGLMLVERKVLEDMGAPWFVCGRNSSGGEDFFFCHKAKEHGYQLWADLAVQANHQIQRAFTGRAEFIAAFGYGEENRYDFKTPMVVQVGPDGDGQRVPLEKAMNFPYGVEGYLTYDEGLSLFKLAVLTPVAGVIVELGTYKGRSSVCLAQSRRTLICVDHDRGEALPEPDPAKEGTGLEDQWSIVHDDHRKGGYLQEAAQNLRQFGNVQIWNSDTAEAAKVYDLEQPVSMLFLDADHSPEAVTRDFEAWRPLLARDAIVAFHDFNFEGPQRLVERLVEEEGYEIIHQNDALCAIRKEGGEPL